MASHDYWPLWQLTISRMRIFYREPAAVFWVYGFPLMMAMSLGIAFRDNPREEIRVDLVVEGSGERDQRSDVSRLGWRCSRTLSSGLPPITDFT
jgi:hypothetical protein